MVRIRENKEYTEHKGIEAAPLPEQVHIPLSQHLGKPAAACVKAGDSVLMGQLIARPQGHISSCVHSSVSGVVKSISDWPHPVLGRFQAVAIENDGLDKAQVLPLRSKDEIEGLTAEQIRSIVLDAGIIGMGGAAFPAHVKLNPPKPVKYLIINGAECEPYLTCDSRLMVEKAEEVIKGAGLIARCVSPENVYFAIEENKPEAIEKIGALLGRTAYKLKILKSRYPQGGEKQIIKSVLDKEVPSGKLPFDIEALVHNAATVYAVYEAVYKSKPVYERVLTVTGSCLDEPRNLLVRIGASIGELIEFCRPRRGFAKVVMGGPMMGLAQYSLDTPVIKSTSGVLLLTEKESEKGREEFCIRCGQCVYNCPARLMPTMINLASSHEDWEAAKEYGALDCIECGLCSYVCPSGINLVQSIKLAKIKAGR
ncbi:MAG: electron transport complex subunit RsxC [Candidatus Omnitrophica bacterium]|nr:electron transport complex subunit RsxC [Candidatus Omnitrophota bacterium]